MSLQGIDNFFMRVRTHTCMHTLTKKHPTLGYCGPLSDTPTALQERAPPLPHIRPKLVTHGVCRVFTPLACGPFPACVRTHSCPILCCMEAMRGCNRR